MCLQNSQVSQFWSIKLTLLLTGAVLLSHKTRSPPFYPPHLNLMLYFSLYFFIILYNEPKIFKWYLTFTSELGMLLLVLNLHSL